MSAIGLFQNNNVRKMDFFLLSITSGPKKKKDIPLFNIRSCKAKL